MRISAGSSVRSAPDNAADRRSPPRACNCVCASRQFCCHRGITTSCPWPFTHTWRWPYCVGTEASFNDRVAVRKPVLCLQSLEDLLRRVPSGPSLLPALILSASLHARGMVLPFRYTCFNLSQQVHDVLCCICFFPRPISCSSWCSLSHLNWQQIEPGTACGHSAA
jgi:hypothetical protein